MFVRFTYPKNFTQIRGNNMRILPIAKTADVIEQKLGVETLLYNLRTHKAYSLNETSAIIYQACNGKTTFDELKLKNNFSDELIFFTLDELNRENLLKENETYNSPFEDISRREAIKKVGLASMIALPVISSIVAPNAAMAQSVVCLNPNGAPDGTPVAGNSNDSCPACRNFLNAQCCNDSVTSYNCTPGGPFGPFPCSGVCGVEIVNFEAEPDA